MSHESSSPQAIETQGYSIDIQTVMGGDNFGNVPEFRTNLANMSHGMR